VRNGRLAKSIHAALIACKVSGAGGRFVAVDPAHTSPDCRPQRTGSTLADRTSHRPACGLVLDRDRTVARSILRRAKERIRGMVGAW
jgi:transposase